MILINLFDRLLFHGVVFVVCLEHEREQDRVDYKDGGDGGVNVRIHIKEIVDQMFDQEEG
jgi:hypothetical protein